MFKRLNFVLLCLFFITLPSLYSQKDYKNAVVIDLFPMVPGANGLNFGKSLGFGITYEKKINNFFSVTATGSFLTNFKETNSYTISPKMRLYPMKTSLGKLFVDTGLSYRFREDEEVKFHALNVVVGVGYKFILHNRLVLEPGVSFRYKLTEFSGKDKHSGGFGLLLGVGWVF